ncbi:hypothetical protein M405DRAFT_886313, partial [Rhizopogon salebrosus TDB-379]
MQAPQVIPGGPNPRKGPYQEVLVQYRQSTVSTRVLVAKKANEASASQTMIVSSRAQGLTTIAYSHLVGSSGAYLNEPAPPPYLPYPLGLSGADHNGLATQSLVPLGPHPIRSVLLQWWSLTASRYDSTYIPSHMVPRNVANGHQAFNFCPQVPGILPIHSGTAQDLGQNINNLQQPSVDVPQTRNRLLPWPVPADLDVLLARGDACGTDYPLPWLSNLNPIQMGSSEPGTALRATLPAPFLYFINMDMVMASNIIPTMISQKLYDERGERMHQPTGCFTMLDT